MFLYLPAFNTYIIFEYVRMYNFEYFEGLYGREKKEGRIPQFN